MYSQPVAVLGFHSTEEKSKQNWSGFPSWVEQNRDIQYCEFLFCCCPKPDIQYNNNKNNSENPGCYNSNYNKEKFIFVSIIHTNE